MKRICTIFAMASALLLAVSAAQAQDFFAWGRVGAARIEVRAFLTLP